MSRSNWNVYIIQADDGSLYTGITTDVSRRFQQHKAGNGAKYFLGRTPQKVVYQERNHTKSSASIREAEIKKLSKAQKFQLTNL